MGFVCVKEFVDPVSYVCQDVLKLGMLPKMFSSIQS
jgi:hypothetical protein